MELPGIEQPEYPAERVVARNALLQSQELLQKLPLRAPEQRHVRAGLSPAQQRTKPNYQYLMQLMPFRGSRPWVFQILENLLEVVHGTASKPIGATR